MTMSLFSDKGTLMGSRVKLHEPIFKGFTKKDKDRDRTLTLKTILLALIHVVKCKSERKNLTLRLRYRYQQAMPVQDLQLLV
jgi:hypothetical protein